MKLPIEDKKKYLMNLMACGTPQDLFNMVVFEDNTTMNYCEKCFSMKDRVKQCLSCDKDFTPSCSIRHLCVTCQRRNIASRDNDGFGTFIKKG